MTDYHKLKTELEDFAEKSINAKIQAYENNLGVLTKEFKELRTELKPMITAFKESEKYKMVWTDTGIKIKKVATWVVVVGGAITVIGVWLKYGFKLLK